MNDPKPRDQPDDHNNPGNSEVANVNLDQLPEDHQNIPVFSGNSEATNLHLNFPAEPAIEEQVNLQPAALNAKLILIVLPSLKSNSIDLNMYQNFDELANAINRAFCEITNFPRTLDVSIADPVPGFRIRYLTDAEDEEDIYPQNSSWEIFTTDLDRIYIAKL